jgi:hypothetical protein
LQSAASSAGAVSRDYNAFQISAAIRKGYVTKKTEKVRSRTFGEALMTIVRATPLGHQIVAQLKGRLT